MVEMVGLLNGYKKVLAEFEKLNPLDMQIVCCMLIDTAAKKSGQTPPALIDTIKPIISSVYESMGFDGI